MLRHEIPDADWTGTGGQDGRYQEEVGQQRDHHREGREPAEGMITKFEVTITRKPAVSAVRGRDHRTTDDAKGGEQGLALRARGFHDAVETGRSCSARCRPPRAPSATAATTPVARFSLTPAKAHHTQEHDVWNQALRIDRHEADAKVTGTSPKAR